MDAIIWVQDSVLGVWVRESSWALFAALIAHTIGMGFLAGSGLAIDARVLGLASRIPVSAVFRLRPVMLWGLALAAASGVILVIGYPAKALTNPLFYAKLAMAAAAFALTWRLGRTGQGTRVAAAGAMLLWAATVTSGRFLAYTHKMLLAYPS